MPVFLRYIGTMFEVLVFVYENYYAGDSCPEPAHLERKLNAVGFESDEIDDALTWLKGLNTRRGSTGFAGTSNWWHEPGCASATSVRIYPLAEQIHLGPECLGFISFLESAGVLPASMREVVIDRAMAAPGAPVSLDDLKIIILMVYWSFGHEPDALVLDELCDDSSDRIAH
jgi:Smg protein